MINFQLPLSSLASVSLTETAGCLNIVLDRHKESRIVLRSAVGILEWAERIKVGYDGIVGRKDRIKVSWRGKAGRIA